jgi:predicted DNA binding CopG/RHH family protein
MLPNKTSRISIRLPQNDLMEVKRISDARRIAVSQLVREAIYSFMAQEVRT